MQLNKKLSFNVILKHSNRVIKMLKPKKKQIKLLLLKPKNNKMTTRTQKKKKNPDQMASCLQNTKLCIHTPLIYKMLGKVIKILLRVLKWRKRKDFLHI